MEEPAFKRPKLLAEVPSREDWVRWSGNLGRLQEKLLSGCLCNVETIELQRPLLPSSRSNSRGSTSSSSPPLDFPEYYTIEFISTINLLSDTALGQHGTGFICPKILDMATGVSTDERIWELLLESLNSLDKFIGHATTKCLISFLLWTKLPNLDEIFNDLFNSVFVEGGSSSSPSSSLLNPMKLSQTLEVIRGVVQYKDIDEHPLGLQQQQQDRNNDESSASSSQRRRNCIKVEVDTEIESEVKNMCIKSLESWWTRLLSKFHYLLTNYDSKNESAILTFLSLWQSVISVKANLSVVDTKHFHMQLEHFVPHLNASLPSVIWKKILDVFSEILCYGSTLSLQDELADEPCNLAHLIIRCVKNRQFLQSAPYSRSFTGFGGSFVGDVDWEWESINIEENQQQQHLQNNQEISSSLHPANQNKHLVYYPFNKSSHYNYTSNSTSSASSSSSSSSSSSFASYNSNKLMAMASMSSIGRNLFTITGPNKPNTSTSSISPSIISKNNNASTNCDFTPTTTTKNEATISNSEQNINSSSSSSSPGPSKNNNLNIHTTIYVGPSQTAIRLDETYDQDSGGDRPFLQKIVLVVLKSVAVTVKETRAESDSDDSASNSSGSDSDGNDMVIIERSIREVFQQVDAFVKSLLPFHPATPLGEWMVKLFSDQDDALVEAMLCALDTFTGFHGQKIPTPPYFYTTLNPVVTFIAFARTVSEDRDILLDLLMSNETSFLLYFLRFLKFSWRNWSEFVSTCGRDLDKIMGLLIRLRMAIGRLVEKSLFPYNINPVLRLLEKCEDRYESSSNTTTS